MSLFYLPQIDAIQMHIPKNGGSSIRKGAFSHGVEGPVFNVSQIPDRWKRSGISFTFIRDPIERWESICSYLNGLFPGVTTSEIIDLTWKYSKCHAWSRPNDLRDRNEFIAHHALPQTHPNNMPFIPTFVGVMSSDGRDYQRSWALFTKMLGYTKPPDLPRKNASEKGERKWIDEAGLSTILDLYRADVEMFQNRIRSIR